MRFSNGKQLQSRFPTDSRFPLIASFIRKDTRSFLDNLQILFSFNLFTQSLDPHTHTYARSLLGAVVVQCQPAKDALCNFKCTQFVAQC